MPGVSAHAQRRACWWVSGFVLAEGASGAKIDGSVPLDRPEEPVSWGGGRGKPTAAAGLAREKVIVLGVVGS